MNLFSIGNYVGDNWQSKCRSANNVLATRMRALDKIWRGKKISIVNAVIKKFLHPRRDWNIWFLFSFEVYIPLSMGN